MAMTSFQRSSLLLALASLTSSAAAANVNVPTFELNDLLTGHSQDEVATILSTTGLLAVRTDSSLTQHRVTALDGLCRCHEHLGPPTAERTHLVDDATTLRTTVATATAGETPLPLPEQVPQACGSDVAQAMEALRDDVSTVTDAFVLALDRILGVGGSPLLRNSYDGVYNTMSSIQSAANHLEHFHVYSKEPQDEEQHQETPAKHQDGTSSSPHNSKTLRWHTDAGLFLAFVPARDCSSIGQEEALPGDRSFLLPNGEAAQFPNDAVIVMLGVGAEHWLKTPVPLKATRHAVQMQPNQVRAWYGMMSLVPEIAIIQEYPEPKTFGDMKNQMSVASRSRRLSELGQGTAAFDDDEAISIGCGLHSNNKLGGSSTHSNGGASNQRRRLQHVQDPSQCNNKTNFFCWMSCLDIPNAGQIDGYLSEGYSLYCMDPAIYASSGRSVSKAVEPCGYGVHNSNCAGKWTLTSPLVPGYDLQRGGGASGYGAGYDDSQFCYGGTSMYMDGFHWKHTTCIIYLFPEWILSSEGKVAAASFGTLVFGALLEFVIFSRRQTVGQMSAGYLRLGASALFYGLQLSMGYFLMLVIMTYSGPLFLCTVLGLVGGHILFNSKDAFWGKRLANSTKGTTQQTQHGVPSEESRFNMQESAVVGNPSGDNLNDENDNDKNEVPEGITPCCQNEL